MKIPHLAAITMHLSLNESFASSRRRRDHSRQFVKGSLVAFLRRRCGEALSLHGAKGRESTEQDEIILGCCVFSKRLTDGDVSDASPRNRVP